MLYGVLCVLVRPTTLGETFYLVAPPHATCRRLARLHVRMELDGWLAEYCTAVTGAQFPFTAGQILRAANWNMTVTNLGIWVLLNE
jgi:hypothetical protein